MKEKTHPKYEKLVVTCACGNTFETASTKGKLVAEICSECHPFYTGKEKLLDTAGRVEKFNRRYKKQKPEQTEEETEEKAENTEE